MKVLYKRPESLTAEHTIYCAGCGHGIIHRLIAEVIDESIVELFHDMFLVKNLDVVEAQNPKGDEKEKIGDEQERQDYFDSLSHRGNGFYPCNSEKHYHRYYYKNRNLGEEKFLFLLFIMPIC